MRGKASEVSETFALLLEFAQPETDSPRALARVFTETLADPR